MGSCGRRHRSLHNTSGRGRSCIRRDEPHHRSPDPRLLAQGKPIRTTPSATPVISTGSGLREPMHGLPSAVVKSPGAIAVHKACHGVYDEISRLHSAIQCTGAGMCRSARNDRLGEPCLRDEVRRRRTCAGREHPETSANGARVVLPYEAGSRAEDAQRVGRNVSGGTAHPGSRSSGKWVIRRYGSAMTAPL